MRRRTFVVGASAATVAGLAGCLGDDDSGNGDDNSSGNGDENGTESDELETVTEGYPDYATWLVDESGTIHLNFERERAVEAYTLADVISVEREERGPLFSDATTIAESFPAEPAAVVPSVLSFISIDYPFVGQFALGELADIESPSMQVQQVDFTDDAFVFVGDVDRTRLLDRPSITETDSRAGHTIYEVDPDSEFGDGGPFAVDSETVVVPVTDSDDERTQREALNDILDTAEMGVSLSDDFEWLLERCGEGAFAIAGNTIDEDDDDEDDQNDYDFAVEDDRLSEFRTLLADTVSASVMVLDSHDTGHVTRSGFAFDSAGAVPDRAEFTTLIAESASRTNVLTEGNRLVVEAFWE